MTVIFLSAATTKNMQIAPVLARFAPCSGLPLGRSIEIVHVREDQPALAGIPMQRESELSYVAGRISVAVRTDDVGDITFGRKPE